MRIAAAVSVLLLSACATTQVATHRPEVTIADASKKQVLDRIVSAMVGAGAQVKRIDEYSAVFAKVDQSVAAALLYGSRYDPNPEMRFTYTLVDQEGAVRVYASVAMARNPGTAFEALTPVEDPRTAGQLQAALERLKSDLHR